MPIGNPKKMAEAILAARKKDGKDAPEPEPGGDMPPGLLEAMDAFGSAQSPEERARYFKAAFDACESAPHEEAGEKE